MGAGAEAMAVEAFGNGSGRGNNTLRTLDSEGSHCTLAATATTEVAFPRDAAAAMGGSSIPGTLSEAEDEGALSPSDGRRHEVEATLRDGQGAFSGSCRGIPLTLLGDEGGQPWTLRDTDSQPS